MLKRLTFVKASAKDNAQTANGRCNEITVKIQFGADEYDFAEIKKAVDADCKK